MDSRNAFSTLTPVRTRAALRSSYFLGLSRLYYLALRLVYIVVLVQLIGVERYGYFSYAANWYVLLMPLAMWGGNELLISQLARTSAVSQAGFAGTSLSLRALLGVLCSLVIAVSAVFVESNTQLRLLMLVFAQGVIVRSILAWYTAMFAARGQSLIWLKIHVLFTTAEVLLVLWVAYGDASLQSLALTQSAVWWLTLLFASRVHRRHFGPVRFFWEPSVARHLLLRGAALGIATFLLFCMLPGLLLLYRYLQSDLASLGALALVLQVFQIADQLVLVVSNALLPALRLPSAEGPGNLSRFILFALGLCAAIGIALALLVPLTMPWFIAVLPIQRFDAALMLLGDWAWVLAALLALHVLRLVLVTLGAVLRYLLSVFGGMFALLLTLGLAYQTTGVDSGVVLQSMAIALSTVAFFELVFVLTDTRARRAP